MQRQRRVYFAAVLAGISGLSLSGCQIAGAPISTAEGKAPPVTIVHEPEPKTVTVIQREISPALDELASFSKAGNKQESRLQSLSKQYKSDQSSINALRYGAALSIHATTTEQFVRAERLLSEAEADDTTGLATVLLAQIRKQRRLLAKSPAQTEQEPPTGTAIQDQLSDQERTIEQLATENSELRSDLFEARQKIRELAQIETDLAKPKKKSTP